jgi:hypothetical protein
MQAAGAPRHLLLLLDVISCVVLSLFITFLSSVCGTQQHLRNMLGKCSLLHCEHVLRPATSNQGFCEMMGAIQIPSNSS